MGRRHAWTTQAKRQVGAAIKHWEYDVSENCERGFSAPGHQSFDWISKQDLCHANCGHCSDAEAIGRIRRPFLTSHNALLEGKTVYYRIISSPRVPSWSLGMRSCGRLCGLYRVTEKSCNTNYNCFHFESVWLSHTGKTETIRICVEL